MSYLFFNARNAGQGTKMRVNFKNKDSEVHFGYELNEEFYFENDGKYYTFPVERCDKITSD